ncbi:hypothetical protein K5X82_07445 [Halosquirtibacter xylanolyticus]|uniref:hypothetical protein n=1 Tax=Halosquirtibacter xylanolyticus TaxID=3374599 RepID=UPI0037478BF3|nr:hypothetical protein K5X82_07445 [Prolixibacteraceae bacterium]
MDEPRMKYEFLVKTAFKCQRLGDPFKYAIADNYSGNIRKIGHQLISGISLSLIKIAYENEDNTEYPDLYDDLIYLDNKLWKVAITCWKEDTTISRNNAAIQIDEIIDEGTLVIKNAGITPFN